MDNRENLLGIVETFFRWKKPILTLCALAAIGTVIISLLLPNYYKSYTTYYVASPDQAMPEPVGNRLKEKLLYGQDADTDRNLSIAQSSELIDFMVDSFNLFEHYEINPDNEKAASKVRKRFLKLYNVERTKFDAVEISIEDTDKEKAAAMVIAARNKIETISKNIIKQSLDKNARSSTANIKAKERELQILGDSLRILRDKYGIYNTESQTEFLSAQLSSAESQLARNRAKLASLKSMSNVSRDTISFIVANVAGLEKEVEQHQQNMQKLSEGLPKVIALSRAYDQGVKQLSLDSERLKQTQSALEADPPILFLVEEASVPLEKSRPKRSIICIAAVMIAFLLGLLAAILLDMYKDIDWKKVVNAS